MRKIQCDVAVVGAGPAGLAAAGRAKAAGAGRVLLIDRDRELGGILQQCIHNGFGLHLFGEELTGPEYAHKFIAENQEAGVEVLLNTMVLQVRPDRHLYAMNRREGMLDIAAGAVVLAMGCRERNRGAVTIPGTRPAGVITAGTAQRFVNMEGFMPGRHIVILGSGDIGLIMARRFTWEGAKVEGVFEIMPYTNGLTRNVVQCLHDYDIPLHLNHTVVEIHGRERVEAVTVAKVDEKLQPIPGTERRIPCDTLLLSVGLIPENELSRDARIELDPVTGGPVVSDEMETSLPGIFACGNVVHVHDLVDNVTRESRLAGEGAARLVQGRQPGGPVLATRAGEGVRYVVPHRLHLANLAERETTLYMRVREPAEHVRIEASVGGERVLSVRERVVRPAEMVSVKLPPGSLPADCTGTELTLSVVKEGERA
ncbi:NAD(P)/FAD-dependent oxidoreductase [Gelria sp. Kuro-4]|uniref:NAD(P)/FAD-dependent oxidoreductase n=1 Tax=Gelria sp. Kuro-4 TaxID=2796927 RepID=UPI001BF12D69|nr:FAD-dependent oxidoreductase [Gelria sp. Kuro-4]BCV25882.1 pyridine nucleotide-disulfide oxidoreductase [Gelria sp. Kuro-4]